MSNRISVTALVLLMLTNLLFSNADAQRTPTLSKAQTETMTRLKEELAQKPLMYFDDFFMNFPELTQRPDIDLKAEIELVLKDIHPILVGKNIVFDKKWLNEIGVGRALTVQQFQVWRNNTDRIYDSYVKLLGKKPAHGEIVYIALRPKEFFSGDNTPAHANCDLNSICINIDSSAGNMDLLEIKLWGNSHTMMHELAHIFSATLEWVAEMETVAELFVSFAMEDLGAKYGVPRLNFDPTNANSVSRAYTEGDWHRGHRLIYALENFNPATPVFPYEQGVTAIELGSIYELYLLGLVEKVGWGTYQKAIQSYHNGTYTPTKSYEGDEQRIKAREFFDRLDYYFRESKPPRSRPAEGVVLRALPDRGELLDKHFNVKTTPIASP